MPNHLSLLGITHTAISVIALLVAFYALYREGKINPISAPGKLYIWLTVITCVTGFPIMKTGHLAPGRAWPSSLWYCCRWVFMPARIFGKIGAYVQVIILIPATLFLSLIPAVVETLTRLPMSGPIAGGPNDPVITKGLGALLVLFIAGLIYRLLKLRQQAKAG